MSFKSLKSAGIGVLFSGVYILSPLSPLQQPKEFVIEKLIPYLYSMMDYTPYTSNNNPLSEVAGTYKLEETINLKEVPSTQPTIKEKENKLENL